MKRKDGVLIIGILIVVSILALVIYGKQGIAGDTVRIMIDGELYGTYPMIGTQEIKIENEQGYNCIIIEQGQVRMKDADCPDRYCVAHKAISKTNETIVCLPHRLVVEVHGKAVDEIDGVTQ